VHLQGDPAFKIFASVLDLHVPSPSAFFDKYIAPFSASMQDGISAACAKKGAIVCTTADHYTAPHTNKTFMVCCISIANSTGQASPTHTWQFFLKPLNIGAQKKDTTACAKQLLDACAQTGVPFAQVTGLVTDSGTCPMSNAI
jgi:hypothetical protein